MTNTTTEKILEVHHWSDKLFTIKTTRDPAMRFRNGEFTMFGLEVEGKPLLRAYSMASSCYDEHLEFYSIKVPDGPLTSRLQHAQPGDSVLVSKKPTGTLLYDHLRPGKHLYLLSTGTGLAPFLSIIRDPDVYEHPDEFRLDRKKNHHHTFGFGVHFCIGAPLARMEARMVLKALTARFSGLERPADPPGANERVASILLRGFHHLWLTFSE